MILTKTHIRIMEVLRRNILEEFTLSYLTKSIRGLSRAWLFRFLEVLNEKKIILKKTIGGVNFYKLNLDEIDTINYLSYVDVVRYNNLKIDKAIINKLNFCQNYCLILFGSFASGKQRADSDIDICFLIGTDSDKKRLLPLVENAKLKSLTDLHIHYISLAEFEEMLIAKEENLGKQIFRNSVVAFNHMTYFNVLKEAVYHGFKG